MAKKTITYLLLFSFLNYLGCYSSELISRESIITMNDYEGDFSVKMKDNTSYNYLEKTIMFSQDTMYIYHFVSSDRDSINEQYTPIKILIEDITNIETEYLSAGNSCLLGGGILLGVLLILASQMGDIGGK